MAINVETILFKCMDRYMQLDLGFLNLTNKFEWHGGSKEDSSSIHLDVLSVEVYVSG